MTTGTPSSTEEAKRVVLELYEHWIVAPEKVEPLLHEDFQLWHRADVRHTARAAVAFTKQEYLAGLALVQTSMSYEGAPGMKITIVSVTAEDNRVAVEIEAQAVTDARPDYEVHNHAVGIYEVVDGQILTVRAYEDTAMLNHLFSGDDGDGIARKEDDPFMNLDA